MHYFYFVFCSDILHTESIFRENLKGILIAWFEGIGNNSRIEELKYFTFGICGIRAKNYMSIRISVN
jgi:hypothetical protein